MDRFRRHQLNTLDPWYDGSGDPDMSTRKARRRLKADLKTEVEEYYNEVEEDIQELIAMDEELFGREEDLVETEEKFMAEQYRIWLQDMWRQYSGEDFLPLPEEIAS